MVVGKMVRTCPVTKGFTCNTPQDCRRHVVVRRSSRSVAKLFPDVTLFFSELYNARRSSITRLRGVIRCLTLRPSAKRPEGRAARGRPGNVWQIIRSESYLLLLKQSKRNNISILQH